MEPQLLAYLARIASALERIAASAEFMSSLYESVDVDDADTDTNTRSFRLP